MIKKLFVYGTLQKKDVQKKVIGRVVEFKPDTLSGFKKFTVEINNNIYPIINKSLDSSKKINGFVLDIKEEDFKNLDEYETDAYIREIVTLDSGISAWVYKENKL